MSTEICGTIVYYITKVIELQIECTVYFLLVVDTYHITLETSFTYFHVEVSKRSIYYSFSLYIFK